MNRSLARQIGQPGTGGGGGGGTGTVTNTGTLTANQIVIGNGGVDEKVLGTLGTATTVLHGNAAGAPSFGAVVLTSDVSGILPAANGGTANGFTAFSGPATSTKTFTLPNASATVLTDNAAVAVAQGGTGSGTASGARTNLGLGSIATQDASAVAITGGSIAGITDLAVADGGTGASTAANARTNLGLGTIATQAASSVAITGGSITGITDLAIADGGTGQSTATAGFDALAPTTTRGDLIFRGASNNVRLAAGTSGQYLQTKAASADPVWASVPAFTGQLATGDANGFNPTASTTYYFGTLFGVDPGTTDGPPPFFVPRACTLVAVYASFNPVGTHTDTANCSLFVRKNSSADILTVSTTIQLTTQPTNVSSTGNAVALAAGDQVYMKFVTGAWVTPPTIVFANAVLYFEVP